MTDLSQIEEKSFLPSAEQWGAYQAAYHELTKKRDKLEDTVDSPIKVNFSDIEQLHHRLEQISNTYNMLLSNLSITVTYKDKSRRVDTSFEKFRTHHMQGTSCTKAVVLEYDYLLNPKSTPDPARYRIRVMILSGAVYLEEMFNNGLPRLNFLIKSAGYPGGKVSVEFVDYSIAQNYLQTVTGWFQGLPKANHNKVVKFAQSNSHYLPGLFRYFFLLLAGGFAIKSFDAKFGEVSTVASSQFGIALILAAIIVYLFSEFGGFIGGKIEQSIDSVQEMATIQLNEGDARYLGKISDKNKQHWLSAGYKLLFAIFIDVVVAVLCGYFLSW